ncbi:MAG: hypothetical protein ABI528_00700 [bacterium]
MKKIVKIPLKILAGVIISVIIVLGVLYFAIHTQRFNDWLLELTLEKVNSSLNEKENNLTAASLEGNILTGIRINDGKLLIKNDTALSFVYADVKYDLWKLLDKEIRIKELTLHSPQLLLNKIQLNNDSLAWNFTNLFSASDEEDTSASPFDWDVSVGKLKIEDGFFRIVGVRDSLLESGLARGNLDSFDFDKLDISNFQMSLNADYFLKSKKLDLQDLSFNTNSDFNLKKLKFVADIDIDDTITDLHNFELVTDRSNVLIDKLKMAKLDPFGDINYDEFGDKDIEAAINIEKFNFADLKFFIPELTMLDSVVSLKLDANGKYGDLNVSTLEIGLPQSHLKLKGNVKNLQNPSELYSDVEIENMNIRPSDVKLIYKDNSIPDYSHLGTIAGNIKYKGTFEKFFSEFDLTTGAGNVEGNADLDLNNETYTATINTERLDLGKILKDNSMRSSLNTSVYVKGSGFSMNNISADVNYSVMNSSVAGYTINRSGGVIKANRGNINFDVQLASSFGSAVLKGKANLSNIKNPIYNVNGKVSRLDVSKITRSADDKSDLNFSFNVNGRGTGLNDLNGKYNFNFGNSMFAGTNIPAGPLNVELKNSGSNNYVNIDSRIIEFNAKGNFNLASIGKVIESNLSSITNNISRLTGDSTVIVNSGLPYYSDNLNIDYRLLIKDSAEVNSLMKPFGINFYGDVSGNIENNSGGFTNNTILDVKNFTYNDTTIILKNFSGNVNYTNLYQTDEASPFAPYLMKIGLTGDKVTYGGNSFDSLDLNFDLDKGNGNIDLSAKQDSTSSVLLKGTMDLSGNVIVSVIDTFKAKYGSYDAANDDEWKIIYSPGDKISFEQFSIKSKNITADIKGDYSLNSASDLTIESKNIKPQDIFEILNSLDSASHPQLISMKADGSFAVLVNYKGTLEEPEVDLKVTSTDLKYNDSLAGNVNAIIGYANSIVTADIDLENANERGSLKITGEIPYANPLISDTDAVETVFSGSPVKLIFTSKNFSIGPFTRLVPNIPELDGTLNGEINVGGIVAMPELKGKLDLTDGKIFAKLTGMYYDFIFSASTENSKLNIRPLSIYNVDDKKRHLDITGDIDFKDLKINDINLTTSGDVVLLDGSALKNDFGVEGYVLGGVGSNPIKISGNSDKIDITGQFLIKDASISSLPTKGNGYSTESDNFIYENILPDSMPKDTIIVVNEDIFKSLNPFDRGRYISEDSINNESSVFNLDLNVKTEKTIYVSIDFNNLTRDRLFGEINADLNIKTVNNQIYADGSVDILNDSYYRFYRNFKLKDSRIVFNGPIAEPELDISAVYEGTKVNDQFGTSSSYPVKVALGLKGKIDMPEVSIKLFEDDTEVSGNDASSDAITYLLFGRYKSELSASERKTMASSVGTTLGSLYITSFISQTVREIIPFLVDAEFNYTEGKVKDTDIELTSEFGDATVKVGGKLLNKANNFEFSIDYPLNRFLNLNLPQSLILQISREEISNKAIDNSQVFYTTGLKIAYKFRY